METEIVIGEKKYKIRELLATELDDLDWNDKKLLLRKQVTLSTGMSDEEYDKLTLRERLLIVQAINDINGLTDFLPDSGKKNN